MANARVTMRIWSNRPYCSFLILLMTLEKRRTSPGIDQIASEKIASFRSIIKNGRSTPCSVLTNDREMRTFHPVW